MRFFSNSTKRFVLLTAIMAVHLGMVVPLEAQVETALVAAEGYLAGVQNADGSFGTLQRMAPRDSALAVLALVDGASPEPAVTQGAIYLQGVPEANTSFRSRRALALAETGRGYESLLDSLFDFKNGSGFGAFAAHESNVLDTALAVEALALSPSGDQGGETLPEGARLLDIAALLDYLQLHQGADGGWGFPHGSPSDLYLTAEIARILTGLDQLAVGAGVLGSAGDFLLARQQADGGFGDVLETAVAYRALLAAGRGSNLPFGSPVPYLLAAQLGDGSWEDHTFTTAQVVLALRGQRPNLVVVALEAPESSPAGLPIGLTVTITNTGPEPAPASHLEIRYETEDGALAAEAPVPALGPGEEAVVTLDVETAGFSDTLTLYAVADARDEVAEADEDDNAEEAAVTLRAGPDLALFPSDLSVVPERPEPGQGFDLVIHARNLGETEVASFGYRVRRAGAAGPGEELATGTGGPVAPGAAFLLSVPLTFDEGDHTVKVELDPAGEVDEVNESNNLATLGFFVVDPSQPDLALSDVDVVLTPAAPDPGGTVDVALTLHNLGSRDTAAVLELWENGAAGTLLRTWTLDVAAGSAATVNETVALGLGAYSLLAAADPGQEVLETDESNNRAERFFRDLPDLAIGFDNLEVSAGAPGTPEPLAGDPIEVRVTIRNAGTATAGNVLLEVYEGDPAAGGGSIFSETFAEIPASGNRGTGFTWTATAGTNVLVAVADGGDAILEFSETNNRAEREVAVPRPNGPDLVIAGLDRSGLVESAATLEVTGTVAVGVTNAGDEDVTSPFEVRLFEDTNGDGRHGVGEKLLGSAVVTDPLTVGATVTASVAVDATVSFHHPLAWARVDAGDAVTERLESNNAAALYGDCEVEVPAPDFGGVVEEWYLPGVEVETTPIVVQLSDDNGDGKIDSRDTPDVVFHTLDATGRAILAVSGLDGSELWAFRSTPANPLVMHLGQVAAADLDGDGVAEVIGHQRDGRLIALDHTGSLLWVSDKVEGVGDRGLGAPSVGDLDGDGVPEIVLGRAVLSNTGELIALGTANQGQNYNYYVLFGAVLVPGATAYPHSVIADVDLDGVNEIVAGDAVYRLNGNTLEVVWDANVPDKLMVDGFSAVGNLDADPEAEIVYVSSGQILVMNHDGSYAAGRTVMVPFSPFSMPTYWGGPPTIADLDGDAAPEILVGTATHLIAYRSNLSTLWRRPIAQDFGAIHGVSAFDLDGDGTREVFFLAGTVNGDSRTFYVLDGATGATLYTRENISKTAMEYPVIADVDGDGRAEILVPSNVGFNGDASTQGLHVLGHPSWQGTRPIWNQYGYHVTNVALDGTVPSPQTPPWLASAGHAGNTFRANRELAAPPLLLPNLTVSFPRVAAPGEAGVPVTLRIGNGGRAAVPAGVEVALYAGDPATAEPVAIAVTTRGLWPGAWEEVEALWSVAGPPGALVFAVVDPSGAVAECDETDNQVAFEMTETVLPDLVIPAGGVVAPSPRVAGQLVPVTVTVTNSGTATADYLVRLYDGSGAEAAVLGEATGTALLPGEVRSLTLPWDTLGARGLHLLHAVVDPDETVLELDEENNRGLGAVELLAPSRPDLELTALQVSPSPLEAGAQVTLRATVTNRGTPLLGGFEVAFRANGFELGRRSWPGLLETGASGTLELIADSAAMTGLVLFTAEADPGAAIDEEDESNNEAAVELLVAASSVALGVEADRLAYSPGETIAIEVSVTDHGAAARMLDLDLRLVDTFGVVVTAVAEQPVTTVPGTALALDFATETPASLPGVYALIAELSQDGVVMATGNTFLSVVAIRSATASILSDRDAYTPLQAALFFGRVRNTSPNTTLHGAVARLAVTAADATEAFTHEHTFQALFPGAEAPVNATWEIANAPPGEYTASLSLREENGKLLAFSSTPLTVESSAETGAGLRGELAVTPSRLGAGAPLVSFWSVEHTGNTDLVGLVLRVDFLDLASATVLGFVDTVLDLPRGAAREGSLVYDSIELPPSSYLAVLKANLPAGEVRLASQPFTVERGVSVGDAEVAEGDSGSRLALFPVTLSSPSAESVTVPYSTLDASALAGLDFTPSEGELVFAPGETAKEIAVEVLGDTELEVDEIFLVVLGTPVGSLAGDPNGVGTIVDEEGCASPNLLANPGAEDEGPGLEPAGWTASGQIIRGSGDPEPLAGTAYFVLGATSTLTQEVPIAAFAAPVDAGTQSFAFEAFARVVGEPAAGEEIGRLVVEMLDGTGLVLDIHQTAGTADVTGWQVLDEVRVVPAGTRTLRFTLGNDSPSGAAVAFDLLGVRSVGRQTLRVEDTIVDEGDGDGVAALRLVLACPGAGDVSVGYATVPGTAADGDDFLGASGTLTFPAGAPEATLSIDIVGDTTDEDDESFGVVLSGATNAIVLDALGTVTIRDDDGPVAVSASDVTVLEGDAGAASALFEVILSAPSGRRVEVDYTTQAVSAASGVDYEAASGTLTFAPGETLRTVEVAVVGDRLAENDETFLLRLSNPVRATLADAEGRLTIRDDDVVEVSVGDVTESEGDEGATLWLFPLELSLPSDRDVEVVYATLDVTAVAGEDYEAVSGTLVVPAGSTSAEIAVPVYGDAEEEDHETFLVLLTGAVNAALARPEGTGTIYDDDAILISATDDAVREGAGEAVVTVVLSRPSSEEVSVEYGSADVTAVAGEDYDAVAGTLVFPPGTTAQEVRVPVIDDLLAERDERFTVTLSGAVGGAIVGAEASVLITDNDRWHIRTGLSYPTPPYEPPPVEQCLVLNHDGKWRRIAVWNKQKVDLGKSFDRRFRFFLGDPALRQGGIVFALQDKDKLAMGNGSLAMRIEPSVGVELTTDLVFEKPDHMSIMVDGYFHQGGVSYLPGGPTSTSFLPDGGTANDGQEHELRVIWNQRDQTLDVHIDDHERLFYTRDVVGEIFNGVEEVFYGFTAEAYHGTDGKALQYICEIDFCDGTESPKISIGDARIVEGDSATSEMSFPVTLACPSEHEVSVSWETKDGTALAGSDYLVSSGVITFAPGETSHHAVVPILNETIGEVHETFTVELSSPQGTELRDALGDGTIVSDDALFVVEGGSIVEGDDPMPSASNWGPNLFRVSLPGPVIRTATVKYRLVSGSAVVGEDVKSATDTLTFEPGETVQALRVLHIADRRQEGDESFFIELYDPVNGSVLAERFEVVIEDDDYDCPASPNLVVNGGGNVPGDEIFGWTIVGPAGSWSYWGSGVDRTRSIGALGGYVDREIYQDVDVSGFAERIDLGRQLFRFEGYLERHHATGHPEIVVEMRDVTGQAVLETASYSVDIQPDRYWSTRPRFAKLLQAPAGTRTVRVRLISRANGTFYSNSTFDVISLHSLEVPVLKVSDTTVVEGDAGTVTAKLNVDLVCPHFLPVGVDYFTADGTATAPEDYTATSGSLVFLPGETHKEVTVTVLGDTRQEGDESFELRLGAATEAAVADPAGVATITDDELHVDVLPTTSVLEGDSGTTWIPFKVRLSRSSDIELRVGYTAVGTSATAGEDFLETTGTLSFLPGETEKQVQVPVVGDTLQENDECFELVLTSTTSGALGVDRRSACILDDDVLISIADAPQAAEGGPASPGKLVFSVTLSRSISQKITVDYATSDVTALAGEDYEATSGTLTFSSGKTQATIEVPLLGDDVPEVSESLSLGISNPSVGQLGRSEADGFILDEDDCLGPELLRNRGGEEQPHADTPGWTAVEGGQWSAVADSFAPEGSRSFNPGNVASAELIQDVDLSAFAESIDRGIQRFLFTGAVKTRNADRARVVVELRDAANATVLDIFDTGEMTAPDVWRRLAGLQRPVAGTRWARLRLIGRRLSGSGRLEAFFDDLSLKPLGRPPVVDAEAVIVREDEPSGEAAITLRLSCAAREELSVDFRTVDGTALGGADFLAREGTVTFAFGEESSTLRIPLVDDALDEDAETFVVELSSDSVSVRDDAVSVLILDDEAQVVLTSGDVVVREGDGAGTSAELVLRLSGPSDRTARVAYATIDGSALAGADFSPVVGEAVFAPGELETLVTVPVLGDGVPEPHETFSLLFSSPISLSLDDARAEVTILDDDLGGECPGPNLLVNGGNEEPPGQGIVGWSADAGAWSWHAGDPAAGVPEPIEGRYAFAPPAAGVATLSQEVDLSAYAAPIDSGGQELALQGLVASAAGDTARIVLEYRDGAGAVLGTFDSGELTSPSWLPVTDRRAAPVGTRSVLLRLVARRAASTGRIGAFFDAVTLRLLGTRVLTIGDAVVDEGDTGTTPLGFPVVLSCVSDQPVSFDYATRDATATAGSDYAALVGSLVLPAGELRAEVSAEVLGDATPERDETFELVVSNAAGALASEPVAAATVRDDDESELCEYQPPPGIFSPVLEWAWTGSDQVPAYDGVMMTPSVADVSGDGVPDILFHSNGDHANNFIQGVLRVVSGDGSGPVFELTDPAFRTWSPGGIAVGDIDADGLPEILVARYNPSGVMALEHTGELKWFQGGVNPKEGSLAIANVDGVGLPEVVVGAAVLDADGAVRWVVDATAGGSHGTRGGAVTVADLDLDGKAEIISGNRAWRHDGSIFFSTNLSEGFSAVGNFDADPYPEVVTVGNGQIRLSEHDGELLWMVTPDGIVKGGSPTVADFDGDGAPEIGVAGSTQYLVLEGDGSLLWHSTVSDSSSGATGSAVFDFDGDGAAEVVYNDQKYLRVFAGRDGTVLFETPNPSGTLWEYPVIADVDADGNAEIVVGRNQILGYGGSVGVYSSGIFVFGDEADNWVPARRVWNQHAYHVTNVADDLSIPTVALNGWLEPGLNSYRRQTQGGRSSIAAPDLVAADLSVDTVSCPEGVELRARIRNDGDNLVGAALNVAFYAGDPAAGGELLGVVQTTEALDPEGLTEVALAVVSPPSGAETLCVVADDDGSGTGQANECREENNTLCVPIAPLCDTDPVLTAGKAVTLAADTNGDGVANPGETLLYSIEVGNTGAGPATAVTLVDSIPVHTSLVAGSVVTPGTVVSESPLEVSLGSLESGSAVSVSFAVRIDALLPAGVTEVSNQAVVSSAELDPVPSDDPATASPGDPTVTPVAGTPELTAAKTDALLVDQDLDEVASPGDVVRYTITVENMGTSAASGVLVRDLVPEHTVLVAGSVTASLGDVVTEEPVEVDVGVLAAGASAVVTFDVTVVRPFPLGVDTVSNRGTVLSDQLPVLLTDDPDVDGAADPTVTQVTAAPRLVAKKTDALAADHDGNGVPSPGDEIAYTVTLSNEGSRAATGVYFLDPVPKHTMLVAGSVTASAGTVADGVDVEVDVGEIAVSAEVTITFRVAVVNPIPAGVTEVSNQGAVAADGLDDVLTDDPDAGGDADPTVTPITAAPVLVVEKSDTLFTDAGGDSAASPGDELLYTILVKNTGNTGATSVVLTDTLGAYLTLVAGTAQTSEGTVVGEDPVRVVLGTVAADPVTVTFRATIADSFLWEETTVANQASVTSAELDPVPSDDPDTEPAGDATATEVFITPEASIDDVTVGESDGTAVFTVSLSEPSNRPVTLSFATADAAAAAGADYESALGEVTLAPGETTATVPVTIVSDLIDEPDEPFTLTLTGADGAVLADAGGVGTILDNDDPPLVSIGDVTVEESAGSATFLLTLTAPSSFDITVGYLTADATALASSDYSAAAGQVAIPAGLTNATLSVAVTGDALDEPDEAFSVVLTSPVNVTLGDANGVGTILDDDPPPVLSVTGVTVTEGPLVEAVFTVALSAESGFDVTVGYATADVSALAGLDYTATSGSLTFPAGVTEATLSVPIADDTLDEDDETFTLTLSNAEHAVLPAAPAVGTIVDDDPPPAISIDDVSVAENAGSAVFTLRLDTASGRELRVSYASTDTSARAGFDYTAVSGTVVFPASTTEQTVSVAVTDDTLDEPDETFTVTLTGPVNVTVGDGEAVGTIVDDDDPPDVSIDDVTVVEGDSGTIDALFTLTLTTASGFNVNLGYASADITAIAGSDYFAASGPATIPAGSLTATLRVQVVGDLVDERDESFTVELTNPQHVVIVDGTGAGTIVDDDEALISIDDVTVEEGDSGATDAVFTVTLSTQADREIRVDYATLAGTASESEDYLATSGTLVFPAFTTEQSLTVPVVGDLILEELEETFTVELTNAVEARIADGTGLGTILDDELCEGPNLLVNPSAERRGTEVEIPGWTHADGSDWQRRFSPPDPVDGRVTFFAGSSGLSELYQEVDVRSYALRIAAPGQVFAFEGFVRTFDEVPPDVVRIRVEYRDTNNLVVLDAYDSGEVTSPFEWTRLSDVRAAPAGTGWIRVSLIATRFTGVDADAFVDALSLRSHRAPTLTINDVQVYEGDSGWTDALFTVGLSCAWEHQVDIDYVTADGTALTGEDYLTTSGHLTFPVGTTEQTLAVPVVGDEIDEPNETFMVDLFNAVGAGGLVVLDPQGVGTILNDDFCPRSHGYWKTHTDVWPVYWLELGGVEYELEELLAFLEYKGPDASYHVALQLVATKLDLARGSDPFILPIVAEADAFLAAYPPGSDPRGEDREYGHWIKDQLDAYVNIPCPEDDGGGGGGNGGGNGNGGGSGNGNGNGNGNGGG